jgi:hypothetical protein
LPKDAERHSRAPVRKSPGSGAAHRARTRLTCHQLQAWANLPPAAPASLRARGRPGRSTSVLTQTSPDAAVTPASPEILNDVRWSEADMGTLGIFARESLPWAHNAPGTQLHRQKVHRPVTSVIRFEQVGRRPPKPPDHPETKLVHVGKQGPKCLLVVRFQKNRRPMPQNCLLGASDNVDLAPLDVDLQNGDRFRDAQFVEWDDLGIPASATTMLVWPRLPDGPRCKVPGDLVRPTAICSASTRSPTPFLFTLSSRRENASGSGSIARTLAPRTLV